jgi:large subunit ribosomal protein L34e
MEQYQKSGRFRKTKVRVPGGRVVEHYSEQVPKLASCADCGAYLKGTPRARQAELSRMSKTSKRPKRPFGGKLCTKCTRKEIIRRARA